MSMTFYILTSQLAVEISTITIFILTIFLTLIMTKRYILRKSRSLLFWSSGMWFFSIGILLEIVFALGVYSQLLINIYLLIVALLVEALALGSIQLITSQKIKKTYYFFVVLSTLLLLCSLIVSKTGDIITNYIIYGQLPLLIAITSSLITFPAAIILIIIAVKSYLNRRANKMLSIITGVIIVSIAGTLYIVQYPSFLYIAEFAGILALWYGFI